MYSAFCTTQHRMPVAHIERLLTIKRKRSTHMRQKKNPFSATRFFARFVSLLFSILLDLKWVASDAQKEEQEEINRKSVHIILVWQICTKKNAW